MTHDPLRGRTILVTGASRGIGRAMAEALAGAGARIIVTARARANAEAVAAELPNTGAAHLGLALDLVAGQAAIEEAVDRAWRPVGRIDCVFNNAGEVLMAPALETTEAVWERLLHVNLSGAFFLCQSVGRRMLGGAGGKIVNVASDIGIRGEAMWAAYGASKGGLVALSKSLAWEWAPKVSVNIIAPGPFMTDANKPAFDDPDILAAVKARVPLGLVGDPALHLGPLAVLLASEASDFMTGAVFRVDGGICRS